MQLGSHYPFFETNAALHFDRVAAYGFRLHLPAGTAVRFEPGERKRVTLVARSGERLMYGGNGPFLFVRAVDGFGLEEIIDHIKAAKARALAAEREDRR